MKKYYNEVWGEINEPESFSEIFSLVMDSKFSVSYWRGQSDIAWTIDSSAARRIMNNPYQPKMTSKQMNDAVDLWEGNLISKAKQKLYHFDERGRMLGDVELLARLQHFGASTRLLDFSKSILTALWFCASDLFENTGLLIGIHTDVIGGYGEGLFDFSADYSAFAQKIDLHDEIWMVDAPPIVSRITAQNSVFLCSKCIESSHGTFMLPKQDEYLIKIAISPKVKKESIHALSAYFNITPYTIYPDIEGFAKANSSVWNMINFDRW